MRKRRSIRKLIGYIVLAVLLLAGLVDAIRYLQPAKEPRIPVRMSSSPTPTGPTQLLIVYNASGGVYPGLVDVIWKEISPKTYPCNLCLHAFGRFGPKQEWRDFLASLPYESKAFHKDGFKRQYAFDGAFPALFLGTDSAATLLLSASQINRASSLSELTGMISRSLGVASVKR